ncbi:hypothetical protein CIB95_01115 [Lottiidibacillus patelloidae]|uniref:Uncharacterized protein n=1 Tax=Lottiidibacillus patelloidae TaxID=2670334 RepID=A0A263BWW8_9BACI|nr:hypothetical protein [Lottiidibacillus patelloidae]OZM58204.1 hypothetical protein CIB95_01115 [Lottiidibacillus patelloidae]
MKRIYFLGLILLFLTSCSNNNEKVNAVYHQLSSKLKDIETRHAKEIEDLKQQNESLEDTINSLKDKLTKASSDIEKLDDYVSNLIGSDKRLSHLISYLPQLSRKDGYINVIIEDDLGISVMVDYVQVVQTDTLSTVQIENELVEYVKENAVDDVQFYVLDDSKLKHTTLKEFKDELDVDYKRLFNLYFVEDKLVLVMEMVLQ